MFQDLSSKKREFPQRYFSEKRAGFTLVELIIAIFILGIAITAVLGIFPLGMQIIKFSETATVATHLANAKIEEVISTPYKEIPLGTTTESTLLAPFQRYVREMRVNYVDPSLNLQESSSDTGIKKIEIIVSWKSSLKISNKNIKITTLISEK